MAGVSNKARNHSMTFLSLTFAGASDKVDAMADLLRTRNLITTKELHLTHTINLRSCERPKTSTQMYSSTEFNKRLMAQPQTHKALNHSAHCLLCCGPKNTACNMCFSTSCTH